MKDKTEVIIRIITPKLAERMLTRNPKNRVFRDGVARKYTRDMIAGNWVMNGEAIQFDTNGDLINGQHRLTACVRSGKSFKSLIVANLPPEVVMTIDSGATRSAGDALHFKDVPSGNSIAAASRYAMIFRDPKLIAKSYTHSEIWAFYQANGAIAKGVRVTTTATAGMRSILAALYYISDVVSPHVTEEFAEAWVHGAGERGNPVLTCREKVYKAIISGKPMSTRDKMKLAAYSLVKLYKGGTIAVARPGPEIILPGWTTNTRLK